MNLHYIFKAECVSYKMFWIHFRPQIPIFFSMLTAHQMTTPFSTLPHSLIISAYK